MIIAAAHVSSADGGVFASRPPLQIEMAKSKNG